MKTKEHMSKLRFPNDPLSHWAGQEFVSATQVSDGLFAKPKDDAELRHFRVCVSNLMKSAFRAGAEYGYVRRESEIIEEKDKK